MSTELENNVEDRTDDPAEYPAVDTAFDFVLPSYQFMLSRFESADTRLTALLTFTSTITLAVPLFAKNLNPTIDFHSPLFLLGVGAFLVGATAGVVGRSIGKLALPDPNVIFEKHLGWSNWEFKKNSIGYAGEAFEKNRKKIDKKYWLAMAATVLLLVEVALFSLWIARG
jgi:hypothetical protein